MASHLLNDAQIDHYQRTGYVIPDFRLPDDILMQIKATHARLVEQYPQFTDYCGSLLAFDPWFLEVARTPEILDMLEQLIGPDLHSGIPVSLPSPHVTAPEHPGIKMGNIGPYDRLQPVQPGLHWMTQPLKTAVCDSCRDLISDGNWLNTTIIRQMV